MRVAVILPTAYRGGTLRAARDVALMLKTAHGAPLEVVFAMPTETLEPGVQHDLDAQGISTRPFRWQLVDSVTAKRMAALSYPRIALERAYDRYALMRDGCADLGDCDFWLFVSDRVPAPVFPLRPYGAIVFDCLQRYVPSIMTNEAWDGQVDTLMPFVREAAVVLVTTPMTGADVQTFMGVSRDRIRVAPMTFTAPVVDRRAAAGDAPYILWVTNRSMHKNHAMVLRGLQRYYEEHGGQLAAVIMGTETEFLRPERTYPSVEVVEEYLKPLRESLRDTNVLRAHVTIAGEVSDAVYGQTLAGAHLLLHSSLYDNGTFAALDAVALGVPTLSGRYPAMEYLDRTHGLGVHWFDQTDPDDLAAQLATLAASTIRPPAAPERLASLDWRRNADAFRNLLSPWLTPGA